MRSEEALSRVDERIALLERIKERKWNWLLHWMLRYCILEDIIEGMLDGKTRKRKKDKSYAKTERKAQDLVESKVFNVH